MVRSSAAKVGAAVVGAGRPDVERRNSAHCDLNAPASCDAPTEVPRIFPYEGEGAMGIYSTASEAAAKKKIDDAITGCGRQDRHDQAQGTHQPRFGRQADGEQQSERTSILHRSPRRRRFLDAGYSKSDASRVIQGGGVTTSGQAPTAGVFVFDQQRLDRGFGCHWQADQLRPPEPAALDHGHVDGSDRQ
jgi:hypothetical protein